MKKREGTKGSNKKGRANVKRCKNLCKEEGKEGAKV